MGLTIVLIDDDPDDIAFMQEAVTEVEPRAVCMPFTHPVSAVKALLAMDNMSAPDHIFLDHNMPEMMGLECLKVLRSMKELDSTIISVISTSMETMDVALFTSAGANFAFRKPTNMREYGKLLRVVLDLK